MKQVNLKSMSVDALLSLRERINKTIASRIHSERRDLEMRLQRLRRFDPTETVAKRGPRMGSKVAPKYRNPENRLETWTGRGRQPRWLAAALKTGRKLTDFAIAEAGALTKRRGRKAKH